MPIAALDIGSNSFDLLIAQVSKDGIKPLFRDKRKIQLGGGLDDSNNLSPQAIDRGLSCLRDYLKYLNDYDVHQVVTAATNTLRVAKNPEDFINEAESILMHHIKIISGEQEARYIYQAIQNECKFQDAALVIDIGGGSTEFASGKAATIDIENCASIQAGCVSYSKQFFADGSIQPASIASAIDDCMQRLAEWQTLFHSVTSQRVIGTSGTIQSIALLCAELFNSSSHLIERRRLEDLLHQLLECGEVGALTYQSLTDNRRKILPAGLCILMAIMQFLAIDEMAVGNATLCEGLLLDYACNQLSISGA